jgi:hypothetical protein
VPSTYTRAELLEYRASLIPVRQKAQEEIDRQVLTISAAALGLSLTFYKDVLKEQIVSYGWLLRLAWICWIVAIGSVVLSMYLSAESVRLIRVKIDEVLKAATSGERIDAELDKAGYLHRWLLRVLNPLNLSLFFVGILAFALVFLLNIDTSSHKQHKDETRNPKTSATASSP